jgi:hypothetical protein
VKYAVKIEGERLPYACLNCHPGPCGYDHERKPFYSDFSSATDDAKATTEVHAVAVDVAKARGGRVVRILSHEEAKRKAVAKELRAQAQQARKSGMKSKEDELTEAFAKLIFTAVALAMEERANELWPGARQ